MSTALPGVPIAPLRSFQHQGLRFHIYARPEDMGAASAQALAERQLDLVSTQNAIGFLLMAAPSAFPFYAAYLDLAANSAALREAIARTHFFQFDDYPLPATHPATFRHLLESHFFAKLRAICSRVNYHPLNVDAADPSAICHDYTIEVLRHGPDLQLKGVGENGHWGFHEPGIPLSGDPAYIAVALSEENAAQQLRDHPALFRTPGDVPRTAYTANVPLFLRTRDAIEDNVPQASKAFALLAAYATDVVHAAIPSSALKRHKHATVRTTAAAAWALEEFLACDTVSADMLHRISAVLANETALTATLRTMGLRVDL